MKHQSFLIALIYSALFTSGASPAASQRSSTSLEQANRLYMGGQTLACLKVIEDSLQARPRDAALHYLKGHCFLKLKNLPQAAHEYMLAEQIEPSSKTGQYARLMREKVEAAQRAAFKNGTKTKQNEDSELSEQEEEDTESHYLPGSSKLPPGTLDLIRSQASQASSQAIRTGEAEADGELKKGDNQAKSIKERAERLARLSGNSARADGTPLSGADAEYILSRAAADADLIKRQAASKALSKRREYEGKAEGLKEQAARLEAQLLDDREYSSREIKLNPVGTNLYIRNYTSVKPAPLASLSARAERLSGHNPEGKQTESAQLRSVDSRASLSGQGRANGKAVGSGENTSESLVKGEVLPR